MNSIKEEVTQALRDIAQERSRQVESEGWTPEHDDEYRAGELPSAAACYALHAGRREGQHVMPPIRSWPWDERWWKPSSRRRDLVKAAALIVAEIERLDRQTITESQTDAD